MSEAHTGQSRLFSAGLAEVVLIVKNVRASARFYHDVVGLIPERDIDDQWAWFWAGPPGELQRIGLHKGSFLCEELSSSLKGERWEQVHCAFTVPHEHLIDAVAQVCAQGVGIFGPIHCDWMQATSYYFYDPDGNLLEFWSPDPGSIEQESQRRKNDQGEEL